MPVDITRIVDHNLIEQAKSNPRDYTYFHASEWDRCHRKIAYEYYEARGFINIDISCLIIDPRMQRVFDNGHSVHDRWKDYFVQTGALLGRWECLNWAAHKDRRVIFGLTSKLGILKPDSCDCGSTLFKYIEVGFRDDETWWGGHVDAVMDSAILKKHKSNTLIKGAETISPEIEDCLFIVDFKSIGYGYKDLTAPKPEHYTQMQIYLYLSGLKYGKFIYESKETQAVKEYLVVRDDEFLAIKKEEAIRLKHIVTHTNSQGKRVLPQRAYNSRAHRECLQCKYRGNCWGDGK